MDFRTLKNIIETHNIPEDVTLMSDSGWECDATDMNGLYYNEKKNTIVFTQQGTEYDYHYFNDPEWKLLHSRPNKYGW